MWKESEENVYSDGGKYRRESEKSEDGGKCERRERGQAWQVKTNLEDT